MAISWTNGPNGLTGATRPGPANVGIMIDADAPPLEQFAADELGTYLAKLYRIDAARPARPDGFRGTLFLVGSPATNPHILKALGEKGWPDTSDQGIVLKRVRYASQPALVVGGGSPIATLWAVYELIERWGVTYLLHGDVLPVDADPQAAVALTVPSDDIIMEPALPIRWWRADVPGLAGPASWGLNDYRAFLGQLAKMHFNRLCLPASLEPSPTVHDEESAEASGTRSAFPDGVRITDDIPGRPVFGQADVFGNPDLPTNADADALRRARIELVRKIITLASRFGIDCGVTVRVCEPQPKDDPSAPPSGSDESVDTPERSTRPSPTDGDALTDLVAANVRSATEAYPNCRWIMIDVRDFEAWSSLAEHARQALAQRVDDDKLPAPLKAREDTSATKTDGANADEPQRELEAGLVGLHVVDRLTNDLGVFSETGAEGFPPVVMNVPADLLPIAARVLPDRAEVLNEVDRSSALDARTMESLRPLREGGVRAALTLRLQDDQLGLLPRSAVEECGWFADAALSEQWSGLALQAGLINDHDLPVGFLARQAWKPDLERDAFYEGQLRAVCGEQAVDAMMQALREVQAATTILDEQGRGLTSPSPTMMMRFWRPGSAPQWLRNVQHHYNQAMTLMRQADRARRAALGRARSRARSAAADDYLGTWMQRCSFGGQYICTIECVHQAATAEAEARHVEQTGDDEKTKQKLAVAAKSAKHALRIAGQMIATYASVARDQSDRGAVAVLAEYVWRPMRDKTRQLDEEANP